MSLHKIRDPESNKNNNNNKRKMKEEDGESTNQMGQTEIITEQNEGVSECQSVRVKE